MENELTIIKMLLTAVATLSGVIVKLYLDSMSKDKAYIKLAKEYVETMKQVFIKNTHHDN